MLYSKDMEIILFNYTTPHTYAHARTCTHMHIHTRAHMHTNTHNTGARADTS